MQMANIVVLGAGVMGSAFTMPLADNGHRVKLVGTHLDADIIEEIHETRVHPRLGSQLRAVVTPYTYDRLGEALQGVDLVVIGVNSLGIDWAGEMLRDTLPAGTPLLFLTKGLSGEGDRLELLPHRLRRHLTPVQQRSTPLLAVGGPSIAGELAEARDTCVVVTGDDAALAHKLAGMLRTRYYHVWPSTDMVGVETCVALKNLYALAVGCVGGLLAKRGKAGNEAVMHNLAAAIFAQGLWETGVHGRFHGRATAQRLYPARRWRPLRDEYGRAQQPDGFVPGAGDALFGRQARLHGGCHHRGRAVGAGHRSDHRGVAGAGQARSCRAAADEADDRHRDP
jgi:glycerol-3-phosphate dehydrogenase (NAD(P)+)